MYTKNVTSKAGKLYTYTKDQEIEFSKFVEGYKSKKVVCLKCDIEFMGTKGNRICGKCKSKQEKQ